MKNLIILAHRKEYLSGTLTVEMISTNSYVKSTLSTEQIKILHPVIYNYPHNPIFDNYQKDKAVIKEITEDCTQCIVTIKANGITKKRTISVGEEGRDFICQLF